MTSLTRSAGKRVRTQAVCPGWPPGARPDRFFAGGRGALGRSVEGGREEFCEFWLRRASRSCTRVVKEVTCCCKAAITASRSRHPWHWGTLMLPDYELGKPWGGLGAESTERLRLHVGQDATPGHVDGGYRQPQFTSSLGRALSADAGPPERLPGGRGDGRLNLLGGPVEQAPAVVIFPRPVLAR